MAVSHAHSCEALVVMCMDFRFRDWVPEKVADLTDLSGYDLVSYAGGALLLGSDDPTEREALLSQVRLSNRLHGISKVVLADHEDCGAYGGSKAFSSRSEEFECHRVKMTKAAAAIRCELPHLRVILSYARMDGSMQVVAESADPATRILDAAVA
jgi:hypothetical protein